MDGIVKNSNEDYHAGEGESSTSLKLLAYKTPLHFWERRLNPERKDKEPSRALVIGSATHCALLEPDDFPLRYAIKPDVSAATIKGKALYLYLENPDAFTSNHQPIPDGISKSKEGKALIAEIEANGKTAMEEAVFNFAVNNGAELYGKTLLSGDEYETVMRIAQALAAHPVGRFLLTRKGAQVETSLYWTDRETGILCKCRPDLFIEPCSEFPNGMIFDAKSCEDASPEGFAKSAYNFGYHLSAALYTDGFQEVFKTSQPPAFIFGASEKEPPFATKFYNASEMQIRLGRYDYRRALQTLKQCRETGVWPGYDKAVSDLDLPPFALKKFTDIFGVEQ